MKKFLVSVVVTLMVLIGLAIAVPHFVDVNKYKPQITDAVKRSTGRDLTINGNIALSVFPDISLGVSDVTLGNIPGAKQKNMASIKELQLQVALLPLIQGRDIRIKKFVLVDPDIYLLVTKSGAKNWQFTEAKATPQQPVANENSGNTVPAGISQIQDVGIRNGTLHYVNEQENKTVNLTKVNSSLSLSGSNSPLVLTGEAVWNGEKVSTEIEIDNSKDFLSQKETGAKLNISSEVASASYKGSLQLAKSIRTKGDLEAEVKDINKLQSWLDPNTPKNNDIHQFNVKTAVNYDGTKAVLSNLEVALDDAAIRGDVSIDTAKTVPFIQGKLSAGDINLESYFASSADKSGSGASSTEAQGWSDEPLKLDGLRKVDADISLTAKSFAIPKLHTGNIDTKIALHGGRLNATLNEVALYDGSLKGNVIVDASGAVPSMKKTFTLSHVNAEKMFTDMAKFNKVSGTLNATMDVSASGRSQRAMVSNLNGRGSFNLAEGKIRGVNLISMARNVATAFKTGNTSQETEFSSATGTMVITNGIVQNNDLLMKAPLLNIQGSGTADLPRKYLDYRLVPQIVGTFKGSTQDASAPGVAVPIKVKGPFSKLTFAPDVGGVIKNVLQDPLKAKENLKSLEDSIKSIGKGLKLELR